MIEEYDGRQIRSRKIFRVVLVPFIGVLLLMLLVRIVPGISLRVLPVERVLISGVRYMDRGEIVSSIGLESKSLLFFNPRRARKILLLDERVEKVEMAKLYPDTVKIHMVEKSAAAVLQTGTQSFVLSRGGIVLTELPKMEKGEGYSDYPLITLLSHNDDIKTGKSIDNFLVLALLEAVDRFGREYPEFAGRIERYSVDGTGITVHVGESRVFLGGTVSSGKLERLRALMLVLQSTGEMDSAQIDMSFSAAAVGEGETTDEL